MPGDGMKAENMPQATCLASLHDVMPETWTEVNEILAWLKERNVPPVTLLVVPGRQWSSDQIRQLRAWADEGHPLAAHGWYHHVERIRGLRHRLHATLISRNVAEHLVLNSDEILGLLKRSKNWFSEQGLPTPELYVPPAWALGPISKGNLRKAPYSCIEVTRGLIRPDKLSKLKLPLTGFEADTALREAFLRRWNARAVKQAKRTGRPLRLSIHPYDLQLRVADQLETIVQLEWRYLRYEQALST
jgi:hypothetical protein